VSAPTSVSVLVDVPAIDRAFDYAVPEQFVDRVEVGSVVRVSLAGRRVDGWVLEVDPPTPPGVTLQPILQVSGIGPSSDVIDLCGWVAWRWAGRLASVLRHGTPDRRVHSRPPIHPRPPARGIPDPVALDLFRRGPGTWVLEWPVDADLAPVALAAASLGQALVVAGAADTVTAVGTALRRSGAAAARWNRDFSAALGGATVVGGRGAVFAPTPALAAVVVIDEHDPRLQQEESPTWNAREVAIERARRAGVPCVLVSPIPTLEARRAASAPPVPAAADMAGSWPRLEIVDRREEDRGRTGLFSPTLVERIRTVRASGERVVCVVNRTGRARLLACRSCGTVAACERCGAVVRQDEAGLLVCLRCGDTRPLVCAACGSTALSNLRPGVTTVREQLEALVREPVIAVTGGSRRTPGDAIADNVGVVVGTEAVLHRIHAAGLVALLDVDAELLAPRYRAAEESLGLIVAAGRLVGGRRHGGGTVLVQTRDPEHQVLRAAAAGDPSDLVESTWREREALGDPPAATIAVVGREAAPAFMERLAPIEGIERLGPDASGQWLLRSWDQRLLLDALAQVERPSGRLRLWVDPLRTG